MTNETNRGYSARCGWKSGMLRVRILLIVLVSSPLLLLAQNPPSAPSKVDAKQIYAKLCAGCHGADAHGTQQGPGLSGNPQLRRRPLPRLRSLIRNGIPAAGMPPFDLPDDALDALTTLVVSLNSSASEIAVPGDRAAGKKFFFGKGQCDSCHMVFGAGHPLGPDLSDLGKEMTVDQIREALLHPDATITPGYDLVTARLRDGQTLRGFARSRTEFDIQLQDLAGRLHSLSLDQVSAITDEKNSLMQPLKASPDELQDLIAYLSRLAGVQPGVPTSAQSAAKGGIDFSRILNPRPGDWLTYNGKLSGNRYSELTQINATNLNKLGVKWTFSIPLWSQFLPDTPYFHENMRYFGLETVPIVADGIMYVTGPNQAFALDARTGHQIWQYSRPRTPGLVSDASLGTNRGMAILGDNVFMVTDNAHLIALNRITGRLVWEVVMPDEPQHYGATVSPLIVKDMVIAGVSGGDWGIRGFLAAYKATSGERVWRHWTVPSKGEPGYDTWKGSAVTYGGGATWLTGSYDPETDTLYWATGNPYPDSDDRERGGDNLFTNCVLALNPDTGKLKWYYQFSPHDVHDWDATEPNVLVDTKYHGQDRRLLLHADRNGFFYVFDRKDGQLLTTQKLIRRMTWASGIGPDGRPLLLPETDTTCPESATNWNGTAFSPVTHLYYVMVLEKCTVKLSPGSWKSEHPKVEPGEKYLRAFDIDTGNTVWEVPELGEIDGKRDAGVLATAAGMVLYGDPSGEFVAVDERDGKTLWHFPLNAVMKTSPMTFTVDGEQFIAISVGSNIVCFGLIR
jgi:PQQ-dependent dehydrogenase (methanol/ethanol family)